MVFKRENKYEVLRQEDIKKLPGGLRESLGAALGWIRAGRIVEGKKDNTYIVINEDELYAELVWKLVQLREEKPDGYRNLINGLDNAISLALR